MNYEAIYTRIMTRCHHAVSETTLLGYVKNWINDRYHRAWAALCQQDPTFGRGEYRFSTTDDYNTGTVDVTNASTSVSGNSTVWTAGMEGRKFKVESYAEVYEISTVGDATSITLANAYNGDSDSAISYIIYKDEYSLPSDCADIVRIGQYASYIQLTKIGIGEMQEKALESPISVNPVKIMDPEYWAYVNDSTIIVYPAPTRAILLEMYYTKKFTELSVTTSEPLLPIDWHNLLVVGGMADLYEYDDDQRYIQKNQEFDNILHTLLLKNAGKTDPLTMYPKVHRT